MSGEFVVTRLDDAGDGVIEMADGHRAVPLALPGDRVMLEKDGARVLPAVDHALPPCPIFERCGGCRTQHMPDALYVRWKVDRLARAFAAHGLNPEIAPLARSPLAVRRRMTITAKRGGGPIGYFARASHQIIDVAACPALAPALDAALPALRRLAASATATAAEVRLTATLCDNGVDAAITTRTEPSRQRGKRARPRPAPPLVSEDPAIVRIARDGETLITIEAPIVTFDGVAVPFPPGAFLQATREGEAALTAAVLAGVGAASHVLDAFCGLGTFSLPLARHASVTAIDFDGPAIAALEAAARHASGRKPVTTMRRDLLRHPPSPAELSRYDAAVFDPPRAGARGLAQSLADSTLKTVVAVSCEPATLARDCAILVAGGFKITHVLPVDQFVATPHIEAVVRLRRE